MGRHSKDCTYLGGFCTRPPDRRRGKLLFSHHNYSNFRRNILVLAHGNLVLAQLLDRLVHLDLAPVDGIVLGGQRIAHVLRRRERKQRDIPLLPDGVREPPLVRRARARNVARPDLAPLRHPETAHFLAPEILLLLR